MVNNFTVPVPTLLSRQTVPFLYSHNEYINLLNLSLLSVLGQSPMQFLDEKVFVKQFLFACSLVRILFFFPGMNGTMDSSHSGSRTGSHHHHKPRNYKLLVDPFLVKGASKLYRYDGNVPNDPTYPQVQVRDPRSALTRIWTRLEVLDLPVPRFKVSWFFT